MFLRRYEIESIKIDRHSYYAGCSTFLPVFDSNYDTYEALHERSPFALDCICMVAAKVRDGGGEHQLLLHFNGRFFSRDN